MKFKVKMIGPFIYDAGFSEKEFNLAEPVTTESLLTHVGVPKDRPRVITRNGQAIGPSEPIRDGDRIVIAPIYSGG